MNNRDENNVVYLNKPSSANPSAKKPDEEKEKPDLFMRTLDRHYQTVTSIIFDEESVVNKSDMETIIDFVTWLHLFMKIKPWSYSKEDHWKMIYLVSISGCLFEEPLLFDFREEYLLQRMLAAEKKPMEFIVNDRVVIYPYSIYLALSAFHAITDDEDDEGYRWIQYAEDRVPSYIGNRSKSFKDRVGDMFESVKLLYGDDEDISEYSPFLGEEKSDLERFISWGES